MALGAGVFLRPCVQPEIRAALRRRAPLVVAQRSRSAAPEGAGALKGRGRMGLWRRYVQLEIREAIIAIFEDDERNGKFEFEAARCPHAPRAPRLRPAPAPRPRAAAPSGIEP